MCPIINMKKYTSELLVEQLIVVLILIVHLSGFSPMNNSAPEMTQFDGNGDLDQYSYYLKNFQNIAVENPLNAKVIVMVIDALRIDHLVKSNKVLMNYSSHLIQERKALGYVLKTATPTVTLPRIKSMMTGSISSFMDVIFNFDTKELSEENLIHFWKSKQRQLHFFGDETWIKLFPREFHKRDAVTSLYVNDYTEVDNNVTRHITEDYLNSNWDVLILHYLGLDHIGHLEGPNSHLIAPKLNEMDAVIRKIHQHLVLNKKPYIFLVCGDHGMSDSWGHGGASHSEIHTSALVLSHLLDGGNPSPFVKNSSLYREEVHHQVDIASTLALLTGVDIPNQNIGRPFMKLFKKLPVKEQLYGHFKLARQLVHHARYSLPIMEKREVENLYLEVIQLHKNLNQAYDESKKSTLRSNINKILNLYEKFELQTTTYLTDVAQTYDLKFLILSSCLLIMICILSLSTTILFSPKNYSVERDIMKVFGAVLLFGLLALGLNKLEWNVFNDSILYIIPPLIYVSFKLKEFCQSTLQSEHIEVLDSSVMQKSIIVGVLFHPLTLLATSLVEEEHFTYYFTLSTIYFLLFYFLLRSFVRRVYNLSRGSEGYSNEKHPSCEEELYANDCLMADLSSTYGSFPSMYHFHLNLWYYFNNIWKMLFHFQLYDKAKNKSLFLRYIPNLAVIFLSGALFRFGRAFNATGDQWKHVIHINDLIRNSEQHIFQAVIICGILISFLLFHSSGFIFVLLASIGITCRHYPLIESGLMSGVLEAQCAYLAICCLFTTGIFRVAYRYFKFTRSNKITSTIKVDLCVRALLYFEASVALTYLLLQKPENILLTSLLFLHYHLILPVLVRNRLILGLTKWNVYILALWIAQAHFFMEGNSNSLSSIQMSAGFVGITSYLPFIHGTLITLHTFGSRFLVLLHFFIVNICYEKSFKSCCDVMWTWWSLQLLTITIYVLNVTFQRYHLFIWSVFAPKLLYEEVHLLCLLFLTVVLKAITKIFEPKLQS